ncbi:hypothetical protein BDN72DRAFT_813918 [Pluteus cervinus]|uniref:Uncharacterized protein n=1 Tax=Pluteus cervinus TaxID=181527 RepID=A0ACD3B7F5_9AGAR|nr:hypothetical protein BDN72DRAFT_813918 [Pluteus cervinus]
MATSESTNLIDSLASDTDIVSWVNDALDQPYASRDSAVELAELDQHITHIISSLDIACEDSSSELERVIDDVSRGLPRLTYDLHFMKDSAVNLQGSLATARKKSGAVVPDQTAAALEQLQILDTIRSNMEVAREVLQDAESWSTLEMEVTALLSEQSFAKAAERLSEANRNVVIFQNTAEYDPRRTLMVSLQNQLEASLSSALVSAITAQDLGACREYFSIFCNIQREVEFRNYYNASRRTSLVSTWKDAQLVGCDDSSPRNAGTTFLEFLLKFYDAFSSLLNIERVSIPSIFPNPSQTLSSFIIAVLAALQPPFSQRLSAMMSYHGDEALKPTITAFQVTEKFVADVNKVIEKMQFTAISSPRLEEASLKAETSPMKPSHTRRRSSRMSISLRSGWQKSVLGDSLADVEWEQEVFQPFLDVQLDYESLERRILDHTFSKLASQGAGSEVNLTRVLKERVVDVFSSAEDSLGRCQALTYGYGAVGLVKALDKFFQAFVNAWTIHLRPAPSSNANIEETRVVDIDYSPQDWNNFQNILHRLSSLRVFSDRLSIFEGKLWSYIASVAANHKSFQSDPTNHPMTPSRGLTQLMEQSPLYSAELLALLEKGEAPTGREPLSGSGIRQTPLLALTRAEVSSFAKACQVALQDTILSPLQKYLSSYPTAPLWTASEDPTQKNSIASGDLQLPSFSIPPSETIQRVIQGLLNLPGLFEDYADDDALSFSLQSLPYLSNEVLKSLSESFVSSSLAPPIAPRSAALAPLRQLDSEVVSSIWLSSLGYNLLRHFSNTILPAIEALTPAGATQLSVDLESLSNVLRSLNVEPEQLGRWKSAVEMNKSEIGGGLRENSEDPVLLQVARMRGWANLK